MSANRVGFISGYYLIFIVRARDARKRLLPAPQPPKIGADGSALFPKRRGLHFIFTFELPAFVSEIEELSMSMAGLTNPYQVRDVHAPMRHPPQSSTLRETTARSLHLAHIFFRPKIFFLVGKIRFLYDLDLFLSRLYTKLLSPIFFLTRSGQQSQNLIFDIIKKMCNALIFFQE